MTNVHFSWRQIDGVSPYEDTTGVVSVTPLGYSVSEGIILTDASFSKRVDGSHTFVLPPNQTGTFYRFDLEPHCGTPKTEFRMVPDRESINYVELPMVDETAEYIGSSSDPLWVAELNELKAMGGIPGPSAYQVAVERGFVGTEDDWLATIKGDRGEKGLKGDKGDTGLKGDRGEQGLKGDKGDKGDKGEQGLKGDKGEVGVQGDRGFPGPGGLPISISETITETLDPSESAVVSFDFDRSDEFYDGRLVAYYKARFGIPKGLKGEQGLKGDKGDRGEQGLKGDKGEVGVQGDTGLRGADAPFPSLKIGKVTSLPSTSAPTASVSGTSPNFVLDLGLSQGPTGNPSDYIKVGVGRPDTQATTGGIITGSEPIGCEYRSTDGAGVGAWVWRKRPGNKWDVVDGDTGWRRITRTESWTDSTAYYMIRRVESLVYLVSYIKNTSGSLVTWPDVWTWSDPIFSGFRQTPRGNGQGLGLVMRVDNSAAIINMDTTRWTTPQHAPANQVLSFNVNFLTGDSWPTTLPGTAA